jgi:hypothetical protein
MTFILTGKGAVMLEEESVQCCILTTMFCQKGGIKQGKEPSILILKRNLKGLQLIEDGR